MPNDETQRIKEKIVHILLIYPVISTSMLQAGLGPQIVAGLWRPILNELIEHEVIKRESVTMKSPAGRNITYTQLSLMK